MVSTIFEIPHAALIPKTSSFPNKTNIQIPNNNVMHKIVFQAFPCHKLAAS